VLKIVLPWTIVAFLVVFGASSMGLGSGPVVAFLVIAAIVGGIIFFRSRRNSQNKGVPSPDQAAATVRDQDKPLVKRLTADIQHEIDDGDFGDVPDWDFAYELPTDVPVPRRVISNLKSMYISGGWEVDVVNHDGKDYFVLRTPTSSNKPAAPSQ
jgi:hypothetical protein